MRWQKFPRGQRKGLAFPVEIRTYIGSLAIEEMMFDLVVYVFERICE